MSQLRPKQANCRNEPPYPDHETVVFALLAPDMVVHGEGRCPIEYPHSIAECAEFREVSDAR